MDVIYNWLKTGYNTIILLLLIAVVTSAFYSYNRYDNHLETIEKTVLQSKSHKKLDSLINLISINKDSLLLYNNKDYYSLQKDILTTRQELNNLKADVQNEYKDWLSYFANFWAILGLVFGTLAILFSFKSKVKTEVEKTVKIEVEKVVKENLGILYEHLEQIKKHKKYKTESNIIVINKTSTDFPDDFKTVLSLFNVDLSDSKNRLDIDKISELNTNEEYLKRLKNADLVIFENQIQQKRWSLDGEQNSLKSLVQLINNICKHTSLLYFGPDRLPAFENNTVKKNLSFTNASSQLYSNMLNLLKFKYEVKQKNRNV